MKTFKFQKVYETYEEITLTAETFEAAQERAEENWNQCQASGPYLIKERYKVVESTGDVDLDNDNLIDADYIDTYTVE